MMKSRGKRKKNHLNAGFSLLEVILSVSILALISLPLLGYFTDSIRYSAMEANRQQALFLAEGITEGLLAQNRLVTYEADPTGATGGSYSVPFLQGYTYSTSDPLMSSGKGEAVFESIVDGYNVRVTIENKTSTAVKDAKDLTEYGINPLTDVVHIDTTEYNQAVLYFVGVHEAWLAKNPGAERWDEKKIKENMTRTMNVYSAINSTSDYYIAVRYMYYCWGLNNEEKVECPMKKRVIDKHVESANDLKNVYIFYDWCDKGDTVALSGGNISNLGINIIYKPREDDGKVPADVSGYKLTVTGGSIYTNVGNAQLNMSGTVPDRSNVPEPSTLTFSIRTEVYSAGSWDTEDQLAVIETTKGE